MPDEIVEVDLPLHDYAGLLEALLEEALSHLDSAEDPAWAKTWRNLIEVLHDKPKTTVENLIEALGFYADPDTYFAIAFWADRPCGSFMDDVSYADEFTEHPYDRPMPGKLAREALGW